MTTKILRTPSDVVEFWFGSLDYSEISSLEHIKSRFGIWFASASEDFDKVQKANR